MISRNKQQEYALYVIYGALIYQKTNSTYAPDVAIESFTELDYYDTDIFLRELVVKSLIHIKDTEEVLAKNLVNWKFSRLNLISQAILIMSYTHYKYVEIIDKAIIINIAVKFAKKFIVGDDYKYINAVLDRVL